MSWIVWLQEVLLWPARWLEAWIRAAGAGSMLDILVMSAVTLGSAFLSFIVDDEVGMRLIGETPFVKAGAKSFFLGLGPIMLFLTIPFVLALPVDPLTREVALLAWPGALLWSLLILPLYIAADELRTRVYEASDFEYDVGDLAIITCVIAVIAATAYTHLPHPWNAWVGGYLALAAVTAIPVMKMKEKNSVERVAVPLGYA